MSDNHLHSQIVLLMAVFVVGYLPLSVRAAEPLDVADRRELFIDHYLIDQMEDANLVLHQPVDRGSVMRFDQPWEGPFCGYATIIKDGELFRLYYRGLPATDGVERTCYAESADGVHWTKPELGLHEVDGSTANNVILLPRDPSETGGVKELITHNFSPLLDANPSADPAQRFKALAGDGLALYALSSPDGIRWSRMSGGPVIEYEDPGVPDLRGTELTTARYAFDSQNVAFWSEHEQKYVAYVRINLVAPLEPGSTAKRRPGWRSIARAESTDFVNWSELRLMSYSDTGTVMPSNQLYTNHTQPYFRAPHLYLSTAARLMPKRQVLSDEEAAAVGVHPKYFKDTSDAVLMTSRGGYAYERTFMGSFVRPGLGATNWVSRSNYPVLNLVQTGEYEMSIYTNKNYAQPTSHLNRYSMRLDGLGSVQAGYSGGEMLTKPLRFTGNQLTVNFSTSAAGGVLVEIQDEAGHPIPGYALDDCRELIGDDIERVVHWKGGSDVVSLSGRTVRLRFAIHDADLYALRFRDVTSTP